jgi:hypothetical protein
MNAPSRQSSARDRRIMATNSPKPIAACGAPPSMAPRAGSRSARESTTPSSTPSAPNTMNDRRHPCRSAISPAKKPPPIVPM